MAKWAKTAIRCRACPKKINKGVLCEVCSSEYTNWGVKNKKFVYDLQTIEGQVSLDEFLQTIEVNRKPIHKSPSTKHESARLYYNPLTPEQAEANRIQRELWEMAQQRAVEELRARRELLALRERKKQLKKQWKDSQKK